MSSDSSAYLAQLLDAATLDMNDTTFSNITDFLHRFDPRQLQDEGVVKLRQLLELVSNSAPGPLVMDIFYKTIQRYPPNTLTPVHHFIARQSCLDRRYEDVMPLLSEPIDFIPKSCGLSYHDHLLYHFYGGLCFAALRQYSRALSTLALVIAVGGNSTSLIQLEAYKKFVLIGLIEQGRLVNFPSNTSSSTRRTLELLADTYISLAETYGKPDSDVQAYVDTHIEEFTRDHNLGLINSALARIASHKIQKLKKIYVSLRLETLSQKIGLTQDKTKATLTSMVSDGRLVADIDEDGFVIFPMETSSVQDEVAKLEKVHSNIMSVNSRISRLQNVLELDPDYLKWQNGIETSDNKGKGKERALRPPPTMAANDSNPMDEDTDPGI